MSDEIRGITDPHSSSLTASEGRVTMSDRTAQARDAYWNTHPHTNGTALDMDALRFGVEWADATNPAVEALARVRALHAPRTVVQEHDGHLRDTPGPCKGCNEPWPCTTWKATEVDA